MNRFVYGISKSAVRGFLCLYNRLRAEGLESVPAEGPVLLVANHASHLDPPIVGVKIARPVHFLARATLGKLPPLHWYLSALGVIFVDRGGSARSGIAGTIDALQAGRIVCMFPEGTRTHSGRVGAFERGALLVLRRAPVPVVPVGIEGSYGALRRGRLLPRPSRITVRYGAPMAADDVLGQGGVDELRRRICLLAGENPPVDAGDELAGGDRVRGTAAAG